MRTAEEYFNEFIGEGIRVYNESDEKDAKYYIEKAINAAIKEAIEVSASDAFDSIAKGFDSPEAVKQSILSLIN